MATGGPIGAVNGAISGYNTGSKIGSAAQNIVQNCIPSNTLRIQCGANNPRPPATPVMPKPV